MKCKISKKRLQEIILEETEKYISDNYEYNKDAKVVKRTMKNKSKGER